MKLSCSFCLKFNCTFDSWEEWRCNNNTRWRTAHKNSHLDRCWNPEFQSLSYFIATLVTWSRGSLQLRQINSSYNSGALSNFASLPSDTALFISWFHSMKCQVLTTNINSVTYQKECVNTQKKILIVSFVLCHFSDGVKIVSFSHYFLGRDKTLTIIIWTLSKPFTMISFLHLRVPIFYLNVTLIVFRISYVTYYKFLFRWF